MDMASRFHRALDRVGATRSDASAIETLVRRYDMPPRRYHTRTHLVEMLTEVDRLCGGAAVPATVELAVAFHDAVHDPTRADNEQRSAALARRTLRSQGVPRPALAAVVRLVEATGDHDPPSWDFSAALLVDADLWILSAPRERYERYAADVRGEYHHVSDQDWPRGRRAVLQRLDRLLARTGYRVGPLDDRVRRTDAARANLARERTLLTPATPIE